MHVYLRWYEDGKPKTGPLLMVSESAARTAVLERFPKAEFSERRKTDHEPATYSISGVEEVIFAWHELKPVADILFPMDGSPSRTLPAFT